MVSFSKLVKAREIGELACTLVDEVVDLVMMVTKKAVKTMDAK